MSEGIIFCLCGPSGAGKTSLADEVRRSSPYLQRIITVTTREPRIGEVNEIDYHFFSSEQFKQGLESGLFFEHELVHGSYYGTLKGSLEEVINQNKMALIILDVKGAITLKNTFPNSAVNIFITASQKSELEKRLRQRGTYEVEINKRLAAVQSEQNEFCLNYKLFDYLIINDVFEVALSSFNSVLAHELVKRGNPLKFED